MKTLLIVCMLFSFSLASQDAKQIDTIDIPFKEADMLKGYKEFMDVSIHAQTVDEDTQESYFDEDLLDDGIYAVLVRITNNSRSKVLAYSMDAKLVTQSGEKSVRSLQSIIQPYQDSISRNNKILGTIGNIASFGMRFAAGDADADKGDAYARMEAIRNDFYKKTLQEKLLYPGDTISGFLFFNALGIEGKTAIKMKIQPMESLKMYDVTMDVTE